MGTETLIHLLEMNGRASVADLARELNLAEAEVTAQIAELERSGIILGYQAIVDTEKAGNGSSVEALIEVKITPERDGGFDRIAERIAKFSEVQSCYLMSGGYDLMVIVQGPTLQSVARFVSEKLSTIKGVVSTGTHFRLKAYKKDGLLLHREEPPTRLHISP